MINNDDIFFCVLTRKIIFQAKNEQTSKNVGFGTKNGLRGGKMSFTDFFFCCTASRREKAFFLGLTDPK